jgi:hypothetical protein
MDYSAFEYVTQTTYPWGENKLREAIIRLYTSTRRQRRTLQQAIDHAARARFTACMYASPSDSLFDLFRAEGPVVMESPNPDTHSVTDLNYVDTPYYRVFTHLESALLANEQPLWAAYIIMLALGTEIRGGSLEIIEYRTIRHIEQLHDQLCSHNTQDRIIALRWYSLIHNCIISQRLRPYSLIWNS